MEGFFGIGIPEILLVLVLALILLGPQDMVKTARQLGRAVYRLYHSPIWRQLVSTQQELRDLPTKFVREAGLEETMADLKQTGAQVKSDLKDVASAATADLAAAQQEIKSESQAARDEALGVIRDTAAEIKAAPASRPFQPTPANPPLPISLAADPPSPSSELIPPEPPLSWPDEFSS